MKLNKRNAYKIWIYVFLSLFSLCFIIPLVMLFSVSFSTEQDILEYGFSLIPRTFSTMAYQFVFNSPDSLIDAYVVTVLYTITGTAISITVMALCGYALARNNFAYKKMVTVYLLITMFFSGGLIPSYILRTQYLGLQNNIFVYLFSGGVVVPSIIFIFRTFFKQLPASLVESACLDGASEMTILFKIVIPLSKPVIITYALFGAIGRWNDYETSLYYITDKKLYTLQYMLQQVLKESDMIKQTMQMIPGGMENISTIPSETLKFALCVLALIPMLLSFPFFQKYFSRGMTVGAVKG